MSPRKDAAVGGESASPKWVLSFSAVLALTAGFVNAVGILIFAFPVGNVTAVTTQLGMNTANPWLYEGHLLAGIVVGFLVGAAVAGAVLAPTRALLGPRQAAVLTLEAILLLLVATGLEVAGLKTQIAAVGIEPPVVHAVVTAAALGMQNALTSNFRGMAVRTTHFTGTITDLGLMIGRSRRHGIEKWKAMILSATFVLFLAGGVAGLLAGARFGGYALILPAGVCVVVAAVAAIHSQTRRERAVDPVDEPDELEAKAA
ncbi:YoaK family protein [Mycobacterium asiaticum]|nr:YoaK family protein [Mycobacterium asiaticum]